jgi:hypothetical protein
MDSLARIDDLDITEQDDPTAETIVDLRAAVDAFNEARVGPDETSL